MSKTKTYKETVKTPAQWVNWFCHQVDSLHDEAFENGVSWIQLLAFLDNFRREAEEARLKEIIKEVFKCC